MNSTNIQLTALENGKNPTYQYFLRDPVMQQRRGISATCNIEILGRVGGSVKHLEFSCRRLLKGKTTAATQNTVGGEVRIHLSATR